MKKNNKLTIFIVIGLALGIIGGLVVPNFMNEISFLGTIYVNLLKFMIVPIIFTSIVGTIYNSKHKRSKVLIKSIITFVIMFVATFLLTTLVFVLIDPVKYVGTDINFVEWTGEISALNVGEILTNLFPSNIITMIQNNSVFAVILVSFLIGIAASKSKNGNKAIEVIDSFKEIFYKILEYIMYLTPIGVLSLVGSTIANYGSVIIGVGAVYIGIAYLCSILTLLLIMVLPVWLYAKISPVTYIKKVYKIWIMTLTTCSSAATLPNTIRTCNEEFGIPNRITDIVVPLGCTIHMCGGAVSFALLGLFCSSLFGIKVTFVTYIMMLVSATLINMAAPGIPNGGIVLGATYLSMMNIPLTFIGIYSGMYRLLDMSYTTLNVTGDITANILINQSESGNKQGQNY